MLIGYARVSKADGSQSLDLQRDALWAEDTDDAANLYHDFASGARDDRPGLDSCLRALRKGDVLVVRKLAAGVLAAAASGVQMRKVAPPSQIRAYPWPQFL